jgi:hypothetical protein
LEQNFVPWLISGNLDDKHDNDENKNEDAREESILDELLLEVVKLGLKSSILFSIQLSFLNASG